MKKLQIEHDRFFEGDVLYGTYCCYSVGADLNAVVCDVEIQSLSESNISETRAYRLDRKARGKSLKPLRNDALHNEMFVVFGPEISSRQALEALKRLQTSIEEDGLLTGRRTILGDHFFEEIA